MPPVDMQQEKLRGFLAENAKSFKTSWVGLGQGLYTVHRDKLYELWGFEKFEDYTLRELGMKKSFAMKIVKTYFFVEQEEPGYLQAEFSETREATVVPGLESLDILRLARRNKDLNRQDYVKIRQAVFDKGKEPGQVKKDLTALIKERKVVDPIEERERRHEASIRRLVTALKVFKKDMEALKLIEPDIVEVAQGLIQKLEEKV